MRLFRWLSATTIPPSLDLRRCGWHFAGSRAAIDAWPALATADTVASAWGRELGDWRFAPLRSLVLLAGVTDSEQRARLLRIGFGDVIGLGVDLREVEARALRVAERAGSLPRSRELGRLRLDLFARDGFCDGRRLGLHPREFALMWRLAEAPGVAVAKRQLVRDVWRMAHVPDTNSLAVHVFRLREKLASAGLSGLVQTAPSGGYLVAAQRAQAAASPFLLANRDGQEAAAMALSVEQGLPPEPQT